MNSPRLVHILLAVAAAVSALLAAPAIAQANPLKSQIRSLAQQLLADPLDEGSAQKLTQLRQQQRKEREDALEALEKGLQAHLAGRPDVAAQLLRKSLLVPDVVDMADRVLPTSVTALIKKGKGGALSAAPSKPKGPCPECADTGWADCLDCFGAGIRLCENCQGTAKVSAGGRARTCPKCNWSGGLSCEKCRRKGMLPCRACGEIPDAAITEGMVTSGGRDVQAIKIVIEMARYCREGGINFDAVGALRRAPRIVE